MKNAPKDALSIVYLFTNGIEGDGIHGYQGQVFTSTPAQADVYSTLTMMGVVSSPTSASLIANSAAADLYQFKNGLTCTGSLGFQPGIAAGAPGDANYSPMWRIFMIDWDNPDDA